MGRCRYYNYLLKSVNVVHYFQQQCSSPTQTSGQQTDTKINVFSSGDFYFLDVLKNNLPYFMNFFYTLCTYLKMLELLKKRRI